MWRNVAIGVVLAGLLAGCSLGGGSAADPFSVGAYGYTGKQAVLYHYAFTRCYSRARRTAIAEPFGSGPVLFPLREAWPLFAVGAVKPRDRAEKTAVLRGCASGTVAAFSDVHSPHTALICKAQEPYLPPNLPACKG